MKKYLTKVANVTSYEFKSNWCFLIDNSESMNLQESKDDYDIEDFFHDAKEYVDNSFMEAKDTLLNVANNNEDLNIIDMNFELKDNYTAIMIVDLDDEASPEKLEKIEDYLAGQYGDGWGEGLEQHSFATFKTDAENDNEIRRKNRKITNYVFVTLWPRDFTTTYHRKG